MPLPSSVRQVGHHLHILAEGVRPELIEKQRKDHKGGKQQHILHEADDQGILQDLVESGALENGLEIFQTGETQGPLAL